MRLLFINQYYWPDSAATAQMLTDLCEHLAAHGHEVHVIASRGKYDDGSQTGNTMLRRETHNGVHIRRIRATGFGKSSMVAQAFDFASFHLLVGLRTLFVGPRYDAIITLTTPPLIGFYAAPVKTIFRRTKHVCWVMDLHPDVEFALAVMNPRKLLPRFMNWLNTLHLRRATACVSLGECMTNVLKAKGVAPERIRTIRLWGHEEQGGPVEPDDNPLRDELDLRGKFVVGYSGNAGMIHSFNEICDAALALKGDERFVFLFIGGGRRIVEVKNFAEKHKLKNLRVMGYFPREKLRYSLALPDVHLISMREGLAGVSVPSKLFGIMAAARPAVFVGPAASDTAMLIRRLGCGEVVANGDANGLVAALRTLADDAEKRKRQGAAGRAAFESEFNAKVRCETWRGVLERL